ncbi:MAG: RidA family protein, partial [Chloroflexi bacterium]|nr:RidA family protein [Chloroflexota bacterium]
MPPHRLRRLGRFLGWHSVRWEKLLFIAGSTARGTPAETGDIAAQTEVILQKFQHILEANGASLANVVKVTSFV